MLAERAILYRRFCCVSISFAIDSSVVSLRKVTRSISWLERLYFASHADSMADLYAGVSFITSLRGTASAAPVRMPRHLDTPIKVPMLPFSWLDLTT